MDFCLLIISIFGYRQYSLNKLENPPIIRRSGFDLRTLDVLRIIKGRFCRAQNGERIIVDLYRAGAFIVALDGDENFLCWEAATEEDQIRINPIALIEPISTFIKKISGI